MRLKNTLIIQSLIFTGLLALMCNLRGFALVGISGYQKFISPALGIHCGYAHAMHTESCSAYAKREIDEKGFFRGAILSMRRFNACGNLKNAKSI